MKTQLLVGAFFLALAAIFALAARSDFLAAQRHWMPVGQTRRLIAIIFAVVGLGLLLSRLLNH